MSELLKIQDLSVEIMSTRGLVHAVRGVNLTVEPGSIHGIVGESGCGKSVTARSILRLTTSVMSARAAISCLTGRIFWNAPISRCKRYAASR